MSGVEVAGVVLAILPLIEAAIRNYATTVLAVGKYGSSKTSRSEIKRWEETIHQMELLAPKIEVLGDLLSKFDEQIPEHEPSHYALEFASKVYKEATTLVNIMAERFQYSARPRGSVSVSILQSKRNIPEDVIEVTEAFKSLNTTISLAIGIVEAEESEREIRSLHKGHGVQVSADPGFGGGLHWTNNANVSEDAGLILRQELERSLPYRNAARDSDPIRAVALGDINFPGSTNGPGVLQTSDGAVDWAAADYASSNEEESASNQDDRVDDEAGSLNLWQDEIRSISTSFEHDLRVTSGDHGCESVVKDVLMYDEKGDLHRFTCLLDTGATIDCISERKARQLRFGHWLRKLPNAIEVEVAGGGRFNIQFLIKGKWQFCDQKDVSLWYRQQFHVVRDIPYDMILSRQTIFQYDFLIQNLDFSISSGAPVPEDAIERLLPLGIPKLTSDDQAKQDQNTAESEARNEQQRKEELEKQKRKAAEKKKAKQDARSKLGTGSGS